MLFFLNKITSLNSRWNEQPLTQEDFYRICRRCKITVVEIPLRVSGFYYSLLEGHYIAINSRLCPETKTFVMFHELAHFLMHAPDDGVTANFHGVGKQTRKEAEADAFAACALIPRRMVESLRPQQLIEEDGFSVELVKQRIEVLRRFGL